MPRCLLEAYAQGTFLIEVTADQLMALARALDDPVLTIAPWSCTRSLLEPGARSCRLLDPTASAHERVRRSLALRYKGLEQQRTWGRSRYGGEFEKWIESKLVEVTDLATELGFDPILNEGKRSGAGEQWVSATDVVENSLGEAANYRLLSAINHGHVWALELGCFREVTPEGTTIDSVESILGGTRYRKHIEPGNVRFLCGLSGKTLLLALTSKGTLFGWQQNILNAVARAVEDCSDEVRGMLKADWTEWTA